MPCDYLRNHHQIAADNISLDIHTYQGCGNLLYAQRRVYPQAQNENGRV